MLQVLLTVLHAPSCELGPGVDREGSLRCVLTSGDPGNVSFSWAQLMPGRPATDSLYTSEDTDDGLYSPLDLLDTRVTAPGDSCLLEATLAPDTTYR